MFYGKDQIKSVHIIINTKKVKYVINEARDEEPLVTDNSTINVLRYFELFEWGKKS